jgi:DNA-binding response OmpR family regulator
MNDRVLVVSDDHETRRIWAYALNQAGLEVASVTSTEEAMERWSTEVFDLIIVDDHSVDLAGIDVCRTLRTQVVNPLLLLMPSANEAHLLQAYQAGVDECVVKPIGPRLLLAKVKAWLRRSWTLPAEALNDLRTANLRLNPATREVVRGDGSPVKLTNLEFRLLHLLMSQPGQVLESDVIVARVWGHSGEGDTVLLKNLVYRLRRKLEPDPSQPQYIKTVPGSGYSLQSD